MASEHSATYKLLNTILSLWVNRANREISQIIVQAALIPGPDAPGISFGAGQVFADMATLNLHDAALRDVPGVNLSASSWAEAVRIAIDARPQFRQACCRPTWALVSCLLHALHDVLHVAQSHRLTPTSVLCSEEKAIRRSLVTPMG